MKQQRQSKQEFTRFERGALTELLSISVFLQFIYTMVMFAIMVYLASLNAFPYAFIVLIFGAAIVFWDLHNGIKHIRERVKKYNDEN